jgi:hypothetical protein
MIDTYGYILLNVAFPIAISVLAVGLVLWLPFSRFTVPKPKFELATFIFVFGLLGAVVGIVTGASREPVIGFVLPALLTLITGFLTSAYTSHKGLAELRPVVPYCLIALLFLSASFSFIGSKIRTHAENSEFNLDRWKDALRFERIELELEKAQKFKAAGIPLPSASPIVPSTVLPSSIKPPR